MAGRNGAVATPHEGWAVYVRVLRARRGWKQARLAAMLRVSRELVSAWESGRRGVSSDLAPHVLRLGGEAAAAFAPRGGADGVGPAR